MIIVELADGIGTSVLRSQSTESEGEEEVSNVESTVPELSWLVVELSWTESKFRLTSY